MSFRWPIMFFALLLVPLFGLLYARAQQRRRRAAASFGIPASTDSTSGRIGMRRHIPATLFLTGMTILLLALARPQATLSLPRVEGTVILAFDVSGSMAADDLQPTRMEAAKAAARGFVEDQPPSVLIGVVAFSDGGLSVQAPTDDREAVLASIDRLKPQRGTSLGSGILAALSVILSDGSQTPSTALTPSALPTPTPLPRGQYAPAMIILLTDGENNMSPDPLAAAQVAADRGVRIYTIGIGSVAGTTIEVEGFMVHTRLDEALLKQVAMLTDGAYYNAQTEEDLREVYDGLRPQLVVRPKEIEVTSIFAGVSILMLLIGGMVSLLWFGRVP